jgi:uncharacterized repeat protein (TIGR01451 family)
MHPLRMLCAVILLGVGAVASGAPQLSVSAVAVAGGDGDGLIDQSECNELFITISNSGSDAANMAAVLSTAATGAFVVQPASGYGTIPAGASAANQTSFTLSTTEGFYPGEPLVLSLAVAHAGGTQTLPVVIVPPAAATSRHDWTGAVPIPDKTTVEAPVTVSGLAGTLTRARVSFNLNHSRDKDLRIQLVAPDGLAVPLVNKRGNGADFGTGCDDAHRTTLDTGPWPVITHQKAPFVGTFAPDQSLDILRNRHGARVNGVWKLRVRDMKRNNTGTLNCWSLMLDTIPNAPDGGPCAGTPSADLGVTVTAASAVHNGEQIVYGFTVANQSASDATGVVLTNPLPGEVDYVSSSQSTGTGVLAADVVTFNLGSLAAGTSATATVVAAANTAGIVTSTAWLSLNEADTNPADNIAVTSTTVEPSVDLAVTDSATPSPAVKGQPLTYQVRASNNGLDDATSVTLADQFADTATFQSAWGTTGTTELWGSRVSCDAGTLASGDAVEMSVTVVPGQAGTLDNTASALSAEWEASPADNTVTRTITVIDPAGVRDSLLY